MSIDTDVKLLFTTTGNMFPQLKPQKHDEVYGLLQHMSDSMRLEIYLLCVEAWSELCIDLFEDPSLANLQTIAMKWCRVERDKLYQLSNVMQVKEEIKLSAEKPGSYEYWGRVLQEHFLAQQNNAVAIPRCCDVVLFRYLQEGKPVNQFRALSHQKYGDNSYNTLQKRLENQHAFLQLIKTISNRTPENEKQKCLVNISKALKKRIPQQQTNMAKLHYLAIEYMHQGCMSSLQFDPKQVFMFPDLPEFSEFPIIDFYEKVIPDTTAFYSKVLHRPLQTAKPTRTHEVFMNRVHKVGLNNTAGQFILPYVKAEENGWWQTFNEVMGSPITAFRYHRKIQIDLKHMFQDRHEKDLNWFYTQVKHVFESFRQFRYAMLKFRDDGSIVTWTTTHLLNSNQFLYKDIGDLKKTTMVPDDIVQFLSTVQAFCIYPQILNLLEKVTTTSDQIDIFNINPIMNGVPLDVESFGKLSFWLRDRSRFGTVKHETMTEFSVLLRYWESCKGLRECFHSYIESSYRSTALKVLVANPEATIEPMQLLGMGDSLRSPMAKLEAFPDLYKYVQDLSETEKVIVLLYIIPFQLLGRIILNTEDVDVDIQYSANSSMVVNQNFATVKQFAGELLKPDHLWIIGKTLTHQLTAWHLHRNLVRKVFDFEKNVVTQHEKSTLPRLMPGRYWELRRQPSEWVVRRGGVVEKSLPTNSDALHEFIETNFSPDESGENEPISLRPYRLAFQNLYNYTLPQLQKLYKLSKSIDCETEPRSMNSLYLERKTAIRLCDEYLHALHLLEQYHHVFYLQCCFLYCRMLFSDLVSMRNWNVGNKALYDMERFYLNTILWKKEQKLCLYSSSYR